MSGLLPDEHAAHMYLPKVVQTLPVIHLLNFIVILSQELSVFGESTNNTCRARERLKQTERVQLVPDHLIAGFRNGLELQCSSVEERLVLVSVSVF